MAASEMPPMNGSIRIPRFVYLCTCAQRGPIFIKTGHYDVHHDSAKLIIIIY